MSGFLIEPASCFFQFWFFNRLNIILVVTGAMQRKYKINTDSKEAYNSILVYNTHTYLDYDKWILVFLEI